MKRCFGWVVMAGILLATFTPVLAADKKTSASKPVDPAYAEIRDDPALPRVLLIGDSISIGYTLPVRHLLKGKANIHRPPTNCGDTARGLKSMATWLGDKKWDVIHFNWGLHDLKYVDERGTMVAIDKGKQNLSPEQYAQNLRKLVEEMKKTGAKLVWATTTPVPDGTSGRRKGDEIKYNKMAEKVMSENGIAVDDLNALVEKNPRSQLPKNVHFSEEGYKILAESVTRSIEHAMKKQ